MKKQNQNLDLVRYMLALPASIFASSLFPFVNQIFNSRDNIFVIPVLLTFLGTFEYVIPKKNFFTRTINICLYILFFAHGLHKIEEVLLIIIPIVVYLIIIFVYFIISLSESKKDKDCPTLVDKENKK